MNDEWIIEFWQCAKFYLEDCQHCDGKRIKVWCRGPEVKIECSTEQLHTQQSEDEDEEK